MTDSPRVVVTRSFTFSTERVFDAWLDPAMIGRFMFGPALREETILHIELDARVGGGFSFKVRRGDQDIDHIGTYREIGRPRRLVFTWGIAGESVDESVVTIDIVPRGEGCEVTLTHELQPQWADYAPRVAQGWTTMLAALDGILAAGTETRS
jgi:uncharacterized protein YndB with AHSA1/START domain